MQVEFLGDNDRYQLQGPIDRGYISTVYRGQDRALKRVVAIKVLHETYSADPKFITGFQRKAKVVATLQHPNIVQIYDYGKSNGKYYIVMELVQGTNLRRYLRSRGVLNVDHAVSIAHEVALALGAAHSRGIINHNVKPAKILLDHDGPVKPAKILLDHDDPIKLIGFDTLMGDVQYYSPEQVQGEIVTPATDVYSLGLVMYEMLTGRSPFDGNTPVAIAMQHIQDPPLPPSHLNPNIPSSLEEIIMCCLAKEPETRFQDGAQLARVLVHA